MNEKLSSEQNLSEATPEIRSQKFLEFQAMIETGEGKFNSGILENACEQGLITKEELGELALAFLKKIEPKAEEANIDELTKLGNLRMFNEKLNGAMKELRYDKENKREIPLQSLIIIALDMNFLKVLDDTYGHPAGDQGLIALADRLKNSVELEDIVARVGGDEFLILLPIESTRENVHEIIFQRIKEAISGLTIDIQTQEGETIKFPIEVAMGYSILDKTDTQTTAEEFKKHADEAMYQNKKTMKNEIIGG